MSKKVVTLGEIMLRLSTPGFERFVQADSFDVTYGGGEANVAVAVSNYGLNGVLPRFRKMQSGRQPSTTFAVMVWIHNLLLVAANVSEFIS
ncbi:MAG TPA: hypothetical protein VL095_00055 [Flavisolibacter sp.]|nr:hypothetical protein [Flavisolibacter sp.]